MWYTTYWVGEFMGVKLSQFYGVKKARVVFVHEPGIEDVDIS